MPTDEGSVSVYLETSFLLTDQPLENRLAEKILEIPPKSIYNSVK
jgi:hypothetical protein